MLSWKQLLDNMKVKVTKSFKDKVEKTNDSIVVFGFTKYDTNPF